MTDPKWVFSRIQFDLASAIKTNNGQLHIDDALIIAGTPCVLVDFANVSDIELKYIARAMRHFFKRNPRYTRFTKEAVSEGLRLNWLPNLEDEEKFAMLADFKMTPGVDADGYVIYDEEIVNRLTIKDHPDNERYGSENYTRVNLNGTMKRLRNSPTSQKFYSVVNDDGYITANINITVDEWYSIIQDASPLIKEYLACYIQIPDLIASPKEVEEMFGLMADCINARNTALGRRAQLMLDIEVYDNEDKDKRRYWSTAMLKGREENNLFHWIMRPELIEAAKRLAKEENWNLPQKKQK